MYKIEEAHEEACPDVTQQVLPAVLRSCSAYIEADAPKGDDVLLQAVPFDRDAPDQLEATASHKLVAHAVQLWAQRWQTDVVTSDVLQDNLQVSGTAWKSSVQRTQTPGTVLVVV